MASHYEVHSFMTKFSQLSSLGYNANINFECREGKIHVEFTADLGYFPQNCQDIYRSNLNYATCRPNRRHRKHRKRRHKVLATAYANSEEECGQNSGESSQDQDSIDIISQESAENELVPPSNRSVDVNSEGESSFENDAVCQLYGARAIDDSMDYVNSENNDETDPNKAFFSAPSLKTLAPPPPFNPADGQLCRFCDEEFSCWDDFAKHVKEFSFICNNCLDYFPYQPWFLISKLSRVDAGIDDYFYLNQL